MASEMDDSIFKLMVERVQDYAIFLLDKEGHVASWNAGAALIKQYSADEIIVKHFSVFYTPQDIERDWRAQELGEALREGGVEEGGWRLRKCGWRCSRERVVT